MVGHIFKYYNKNLNLDIEIDEMKTVFAKKKTKKKIE